MFSEGLCYRGSVLITGGLGGVGLAMAKWMIEKRNVRHIILLTRRNAREIDMKSVLGKKLNELTNVATKYSAIVQVVKGDVADYDQVRKVVTDINTSEFPLRGIIHGALVLHDSLITNMTEEIFLKVLRPRVRGAWNLHQVLCEQKQELDFFVLLASLRNHVIDIGGANYNASNQFFDSLAHFRRNILGLPALSISVPAVMGTIYVDKSENDPTTLHRAFKPIPFEILFELIERFHHEQYSGNKSLATPAIFAVDWDLVKKEFDYTKIARIQDLADKQSIITQEDLIMEEQSKTISDSSTIKLDDDIHAAVAKIFGANSFDRIDVKKPLVEQGLDSLMAVSLHNWLGSHYSVFISAVDITQGMSVGDIVTCVSAKLTNLSRQKTKIVSTESATEATHTIITRIESIHKQLPTDPSALSRFYRGTSLIAPFSTSFADAEQRILFCIVGNSMEIIDSSFSFATLLASKVKRFSQVCLFLQPAEDDDKKIDLVKEYVIQMRRTQPRGPYYLMGYKLGAAVVSDMCLQLVEYKDARIELLLLFYPPEFFLIDGILEKENKLKQSVDKTVIVNHYAYDQSHQSTSFWSSKTSTGKIKVLQSSWNENKLEQENDKFSEILYQIENSF